VRIFDRPADSMSGEAVVLIIEAVVAIFLATQTDSGFFRALLGILGVLSLVVAFVGDREK
jgi:hypothetical protein